MRTFSPTAHEWLQNYHGSIDATALLLAFDAGRDRGLSDAIGWVESLTSAGFMNQRLARDMRRHFEIEGN